MKIKEWRQNVLKEQGLEGYKIINTKGDGLCMQKSKKIFCPPDNQALFLHEVAHAILPHPNCDVDRTGHGSIWADCFTALCKRYLNKI